MKLRLQIEMRGYGTLDGAKTLSSNWEIEKLKHKLLLDRNSLFALHLGKVERSAVKERLVAPHRNACRVLTLSFIHFSK